LGVLGLREVRKVFFEDNAAAARGLRLYVEGTTGGAFNDEVGAKINGVKVGALYDRGVQFTGSLGAGLEYVWGWGAAHIQISYQTIDPFDEGNSNRSMMTRMLPSCPGWRRLDAPILRSIRGVKPGSDVPTPRLPRILDTWAFLPDADRIP
jgi:hypothetical protein